MSNPKKNDTVKLIKLERGFKEHKNYLGKTGEILRCERDGDRRFYWVRFMIPIPDILFLYRPEIELIEEESYEERR